MKDGLDFVNTFRHFFKVWDNYWEFLRISQTRMPGVPLARFPEWPFFHEIVNLLNAGKRKKINKARQIMMTWLICDWMLWYALTHPASIQVIISRRETEAKHLVDRIRFLYDNLLVRDLTQIWTLTRDSRSEIQIDLNPDFKPLIEEKLDIRWNPSTILSLPSVEEGARTYNPDHAFVDEAGWIDNLEEILDGLDSNAPHITVVSTPPPWPCYFERFWKADNDYIRLEYTWRVRPDHNEQWKRAKIRALKSEAKFQREHECKFVSGTGLVFSGYDPRVQLFIKFPRKDDVIGLFAGIDFGFDDPFVCQWWAATSDNKYWLLVEYRRAGLDLSSHANQILHIERKLKKFYNCRTVRYFSGPSEKQERMDLNEAGVEVEYVKAPVQWSEAEVNRLFQEDRIRIQEDCIGLQGELEIYSPRTRGTNNHSIDAMRYAIVGYERKGKGVRIASIRSHTAPVKKFDEEVTRLRRSRRMRKERLSQILGI